MATSENEAASDATLEEWLSTMFKRWKARRRSKDRQKELEAVLRELQQALHR